MAGLLGGSRRHHDHGRPARSAAGLLPDLFPAADADCVTNEDRSAPDRSTSGLKVGSDIGHRQRRGLLP